MGVTQRINKSLMVWLSCVGWLWIGFVHGNQLLWDGSEILECFQNNQTTSKVTINADYIENTQLLRNFCVIVSRIRNVMALNWWHMITWITFVVGGATQVSKAESSAVILVHYLKLLPLSNLCFLSFVITSLPQKAKRDKNNPKKTRCNYQGSHITGN